MSKRGHRAWICALIVLGCTAATLLLSDTRLFRLLNAKVYDAHFLVRGTQPTHSIVLVTADQKTLDAIPEIQPFWHPYYAETIRAVGTGGAKVMGLDLAFGVPVDKWEPDHDQKLASAVINAPMPVVVGYVPAFSSNPASMRVPVNLVAPALGLSGYPNLSTDDVDDFIRRQELLEAPAGDAPQARSLAFRIFEKHSGEDALYKDGKLTLRGQPIPVDSNRALFINYAGGPGTFPHISMADVLAASAAKDTKRLQGWFKDKIVLLGTDFAGDSDRRNTPFFTILSRGQWTTAGVEIHANTLHTLLTQHFLTPNPNWLRLLAILLATIATVVLSTSVSVSRAIPGLLAIVLSVAVGTHLAFRSGVIMATAEILIAATFALFASIVYRFSSAERRGDLFREAVSLFVGKRVAASLDDARTIGLTGKRETVTILFTDIRGFTAYTEQICESEGPEFLVQQLNEYMGTMAAIVVSFGGHVNKYIGDGILAVFSDEDEGSTPGDHPQRAVQCAARMVTAPSQFQTGAGLHTGLAVVGNVGSADKMEYTVLGDTVNLASRLESLNKEHKTKLLMSETTQQALKGSMETTHLGSVPVRGKAAPIHLYTVTALLETPAEAKHA